MKIPKLPSDDAKSLSFLTFSLIGFIFFNITTDYFTKVVDLVITIVAFMLATIKYLNIDFKIPLIPCKNRCEKNSNLLCYRDKGFIFGLLISIGLIRFIPKNLMIEYQDISLVIGICLVFTTIIHGTLRRYFKLFNNHTFLTFCSWSINLVWEYCLYLYILLRI